MSDTEQFEAAIRSPNPDVALRAVVMELIAEGCQKPDMYSRLEEFLLNLRRRDNRGESDEDVVLDVMDALEGWCHPSAELLLGRKHP